MYVRASIGGTLPGGEVWSINPVFSTLSSGGTPEDPQSLNEAASAVRQVIPATPLRNIMSSATLLNRVRMECRNAAGTLMTVGESAGGNNGGLQNPTKPFQTSLVFSLRTGLAGGSRRGRLYLPCLGGSISTSTLRLTSPTTTDLVGAMAGYLGDVQAAINAELEETYALAVRSPTLGTETAVTSIQVGDILDTQRRRRDKATEDIVEHSYPAV